jgi:hypothetical protein
MAIMTNSTYDAYSDLYIDRERYEREMHLHRMKMEDEYRRQQQMYAQGMNAAQGFGHIQQGQLGQGQIQKPKHDPKDPLSFLNKSDNKLLLTGEAL